MGAELFKPVVFPLFAKQRAILAEIDVTLSGRIKLALMVVFCASNSANFTVFNAAIYSHVSGRVWAKKVTFSKDFSKISQISS